MRAGGVRVSGGWWEGGVGLGEMGTGLQGFTGPWRYLARLPRLLVGRRAL